VNKQYPFLTINFYDNDSLLGKYLPLKENRLYRCEILLHNSETQSIPVYASELNNALQFKIFDSNINLIVLENELYVIPLREGSCQIALHYEGLVLKRELVVYDNFFQKNYMTYFLNSFDKRLLEKNVKLRVIFETCMEFIDIMYAYINDVMTINNAEEIKKRFLMNFIYSRGFDKAQYDTENSLLEQQIDLAYRRLISNLFDIVTSRGTLLSYELFFGALGFDIDVFEFWFNDIGELIEINPVDDTQSTFNKYSISGISNFSDINNEDPRFNVYANNKFNINQKSNFVLPIIHVDNNLELYNSQKFLIDSFLKFLKPKHVQYLSQIIKININSLLTEGTHEIIDFFWNHCFTKTQIQSTINNKLSGSTYNPGEYETWGKKYEYTVKNKLVELGRPVLLEFNQIGVTIPDYQGITYNEYDPKKDPSPVNYGIFTQFLGASQDNQTIIEKDLLDKLKYEDEDFSDSYKKIIPIFKQDTRFMYSQDDFVRGDMFGTIGSVRFFEQNTINLTNNITHLERTSNGSIQIIQESETIIKTPEEKDQDSQEEGNIINQPQEIIIPGMMNNYIRPFIYVNAPPCDINHNDGRLYFGTWDWSKFVRGTAVEHSLILEESFNIGTAFEIYDLLQTPVYYDERLTDGSPKYRYDNNLPLGKPLNNKDALPGSPLYYDTGILLDMRLNIVNTTIFLGDYYREQNNNKTIEEIKTYLINKYNITESDLSNILVRAI